ncbi:MAG: radical SAM protein [uncultured bacterium]|nr:MAG: radical SAM protein [uncultured bacterium]
MLDIVELEVLKQGKLCVRTLSPYPKPRTLEGGDIMNRVIYRVVGEFAHFLNTASGEILTFEINEKDAEFLMTYKGNQEADLTEDTVEFFNEQGQANTRLCRTHLANLGMEFSFPTMVNLELNRRCLLCCLHCYLGKESVESRAPSFIEQMSKKEIVAFFERLKRMGVFLIVLTGGEPFLNTKMEFLVETISRMGFVFEIFSNLQMIPEWFRTIDPTDTRIGRIQTSVYSSDSKVHDQVTTKEGSWSKTMGNLLWLKKHGFYVEVATPLMTLNFDSHGQTRDYFERLNIRQDFSWPIVNEYYSVKTDKSSLNISPEQFRNFCIENPQFLIRIEFVDSNEPICEAGKALFSINAEGIVQPCSQLPVSVGNILISTIDDIYRSREMEFYREMRCSNVERDYVYCFCPGNNYSETGDLFTQPSFVREAISAFERRKEVNGHEEVHTHQECQHSKVRWC